MATILEQLDSLPILANSQTWCLFRQRIEQPEYQRKLVLIVVCVALLLDNMLYMVIVPIIPDYLSSRKKKITFNRESNIYLRQIGAWQTHKEGGKIEYKEITTNNWQLSTAESLIKLETTSQLPENEITTNLNIKPLDNEKEEESDDDYYYKTTKDDDESIIEKRKSSSDVLKSDYDDDLNSENKLINKNTKFKNKNIRNRTHHVLAVRTGSHTVYEGEDSAIGMLFASKAIVQLIVNPLSGTIIDRLGYDRPMMFGLSVLFVSTALFACGRSYGVLFFARSLQGLGSAFADTGGFAMIADRFTEPTEREKALGIALSFVSFGCLFAPPFGGILYEFFGKKLPFIVLSLICLFDGFLVILIMAPVKRQKINSRRSSVLAANKINQQQNQTNSQYQLNSLATSETPKATPIYVLFKDKFILLCAGALVMANISLACLEPTISIWMQDTMSAEEWQLGLIWLPSFFPYVFGVYFTLNYNRKHSSAKYLIAICGLALTSISCLFIPLTTNYYQLFLPIAVLCFGIAVIDTAVFPLLAFIVDTRYVSVYGSVYAIADISYSIAYASGPIVAGNIMEVFGFTWLNIFISIIVAAYCPILFSLKQLNEYNVIDNNGLDTVVSSKPSSLDENSIEDNQINLCVNPTLINHHNLKQNTNYLSNNQYNNHQFNQQYNIYQDNSTNKSFNNQSNVELNMNKINRLSNYD